MRRTQPFAIGPNFITTEVHLPQWLNGKHQQRFTNYTGIHTQEFPAKSPEESAQTHLRACQV